MRSCKLVRSVVAVTIVASLAATASAQTTWYVDADAPGPPDGLTWATAFLNPQDALAVAGANDTIRVAHATYMPDGGFTPVGGAHTAGSGDRAATFQLLNDVTIEGGYAGFGEPEPDARHLVEYATTLSGDLAGDDGPGPFENNGENSYHVATGSGTDQTAVLDGFTISDGNAAGAPGNNHHGGGMSNDGASSNPTVRSCTFRDNSAGEGHGGGMCNDRGASPMVANCRFTGNSAFENGGGMYNYMGSPIVIGCTFVGNDAGRGGGMLNHSSNATVVNCTFSENTVTTNGGGMFNADNSNPGVTNCTFSGNRADQYGGGMFNDYQSNNPEVTNCVFWGNTDDADGDSGGPFTDESAQIHDDPGSASVVSYSCIQGIDTFAGNCSIGNLPEHEPLFADPPNDDLHLAHGSPCIDAGDNTALTEVADLDGNPRRVDDPCTDDCPHCPDPADCGDPQIVDMGAYEFQAPPDTDCDGVPDAVDNCPGTHNPNQTNSDGDSHGDACDNCPFHDNEDQADCDENGIGDVCDDDRDGDGVPNDVDVCPDTPYCDVMLDGRPRLDLNNDCNVDGLDIQLAVQQLLAGCSTCN